MLRLRHRGPIAVALGCAIGLLAGCGGGSSGAATTTTGTRPTPNLAAFLRLPPASPSACPATQNGTTVGRASPWVGTVDVSVFMKPTARTRQVLALAKYLHTDPQVQQTYFESRREAYEEFQRLYTCWTSVPRSATPASYRLVLIHGANIASRDLLVKRLLAKPGVDSVSCDPSVPCVNIVGSPTPRPGATRTHRR